MMKAHDDTPEQQPQPEQANTGNSCGLPRINRKMREAMGVSEDERREIEVLESASSH